MFDSSITYDVKGCLADEIPAPAGRTYLNLYTLSPSGLVSAFLVINVLDVASPTTPTPIPLMAGYNVLSSAVPATFKYHCD